MSLFLLAANDGIGKQYGNTRILTLIYILGITNAEGKIHSDFRISEFLMQVSGFGTVDSPFIVTGEMCHNSVPASTREIRTGLSFDFSRIFRNEERREPLAVCLRTSVFPTSIDTCSLAVSGNTVKQLRNMLSWYSFT